MAKCRRQLPRTFGLLLLGIAALACTGLWYTDHHTCLGSRQPRHCAD